MIPRVSAAVSSSPMAHTIEEGPSLTCKGHDLASPARAMETSCLGPVY